MKKLEVKKELNFFFCTDKVFGAKKLLLLIYCIQNSIVYK